jgi:hypothetical protein
MVGMDDWGWEHVARWTEHRVQLPIGPPFCILAGPTRGSGRSATAARGELRGSRPRAVCGAGSRRTNSDSRDRPVLLEPIWLREEAVAVWSFTELASTLESPPGRNAMRAWGLQLFDALVHGASNDAQMKWLFDRLDLAVFLTIAWTAGDATGRDFARPGTEIASMFGPTLQAVDTPDYGQRPS